MLVNGFAGQYVPPAMHALLLALALVAAPDAGVASRKVDAGRFVAVSPASVSRATVKPGLRARVLLTPASTGVGDVAVASFELNVGVEVPAHRHAGAELLYIVQGKGEAVSGAGVATPVESGQIVYAESNSAHQLRAKTALSVVAFYVPGGPELRFIGQADPETRAATPAAAKADPAPAVFDPSKIAPLSILDGGGIARIVIDHASTPAARAAFSVLELSPNARMKEHAHARQTEVFYFLEGQAEMTDGDAKVAVTAPMVVRIPPGTSHTLEVTSKARARILRLYVAR